MGKIIQLDKRHLVKMAEISLDSDHENDKILKVKLLDYVKEFKRRFKIKHEKFFGYKEAGVLKGFANIKLFFPGHKHCELYWLAVDKEYQGNGIGTNLVSFVEKYAKEKGFRKIFAYTNKTMKRTRKFYEKLGYSLVNEFPGYYGYSNNKYTTAVLYSKVL